MLSIISMNVHGVSLLNVDFICQCLLMDPPFRRTIIPGSDSTILGFSLILRLALGLQFTLLTVLTLALSVTLTPNLNARNSEWRTPGLADCYPKGPYPHSCPSIAVPSSLKFRLSMLLLHSQLLMLLGREPSVPQQMAFSNKVVFDIKCG